MNSNKRRTIILVLGLSLLLLFITGAEVSAQKMKIAVPSNSSDKNAMINEEMGRAPFFLLFDHTGQFLKAVGNPARNQSGGVSKTVVELLVKNNISVVMGDSIGTKMKQALINHDIQYIQKDGPVYGGIASIIQKPPL